jgi:hypothetical protein
VGVKKRLALWCRRVALGLERWAERLDPGTAYAARVAVDDTVTLHLMAWDGSVKHEVSIHHVGVAPAEYAYGGVRYWRRKLVGARVWEYRPVVHG